MINESIIKHSILLDLSLSLSESKSDDNILRNILIKIVKILNCTAGSIYTINSTGFNTTTFKRHSCVPLNISELEDNFTDIINIKYEYNTQSLQNILANFPITKKINEQNFYHFLPLTDLGFLFLESKESPIDKTFLKMLDPILRRISDVIQNNISQTNLIAFRNLFEQIDDFIVMYDRQLDHILDGNQPFWKLIGRLNNPPINESITKYIEINNNANLADEIEHILAADSIISNPRCEGIIKSPKGDIPISIRLLSKSEDNFDKIAFIMKDISLNQELERQKNISEASQRLAGLGEMAGNIAHEINNPLAIINGSTKLLEMFVQGQDLQNKELLNEKIEEIVKACKRINSIVTGLKKVSRDGNLEGKTKYSIKEIVNDALDISSHRLSENEINFEYISQELTIDCILTQISQIIINLLNNSIYAIKNSKERWIRIEEREEEKVIQIIISDSGPGIPSNLQNKIMEKYFTSKPAGDGTGIGLSLSQEIMEKHGGKLYYDDQTPNTTFILEFPKPL